MQKATDKIIALQDALQFFQAAGVVDAVQESPVDAFAVTASRSNARKAAAAAPAAVKAAEPPAQAAARRSDSYSTHSIPTAAPARPPQDSVLSQSEWLARAREEARSARTLAELKARIAAFDGCSLKQTAKNTCIADGTAPQPLMLVGEGPGAEEDRQALPFVGRAGQLLNLMLAAIGFTRESRQQAGSAAAGSAALPQAYITNAVFWRPPGNRTPTLPEIELCRPFLQRQIELVRPRLLLSLGGVAATALLGQKQSVLRLRGHWQHYKTADGQEIPYMPSLHPAFLLRSPGQKKAAWQDFLAVKMRLEELSKT